MTFFEFSFAAITLFAGILDSVKYFFAANKIKKCKTSKSVSRSFLLTSLFTHTTVMAWTIFKLDWIQLIIWTSGIVVVLYTYWITYMYYPNRCGSIWRFTWCDIKRKECSKCKRCFTRFNVPVKRVKKQD